MECMLTFHILNVYVDKTQPRQLKFTFKMQVKCKRADIDSAQDFFVFCRDHYMKPTEQEEHPHYRRMFSLGQQRTETETERGTLLWSHSRKQDNNTVSRWCSHLSFRTGRQVTSVVPVLETERGTCAIQTSLETGTLFIFKRAQGEGNRTAVYVHLCLMSRTCINIPVTCEWFNLITCCSTGFLSFL